MGKTEMLETVHSTLQKCNFFFPLSSCGMKHNILHILWQPWRPWNVFFFYIAVAVSPSITYYCNQAIIAGCLCVTNY